MYHSLALLSDSTVFSWGYNASGQLGNVTPNIFSSVPVLVRNLSGITHIQAGYYHSLAIRRDSTIWTWGFNGYGELGNYSNMNSDVPVQVVGISNAVAIAGGRDLSAAIRADSTLWTWGYNYYGELGNGLNINSNVPVQVSGLTGIIAVNAGVFHALALKSDGTVWAWGFNGFGQLGNGNNTDSNVPVQVSGLTDIVGIAAGYYHSLAMKNDGTAWTWGHNGAGELGNGIFGSTNIPLQVNSLCLGVIGVNEINSPLTISVFPNPFEKEFIVKGTKAKGEIVLVDLMGKEIKKQITLDEETKINSEQLLPGMYMLIYKMGNKIATHKLVKF